MADRLVFHTAFFNLVAGKRQDSADTFRLNPNLRDHSGERIAFFGVTEAAPIGPMGARARRLVLDVVEGEYISRFDIAPGARLKLAIEAAQQALLNEFSGHVRVGLTVLVLEGESVYLLQVPPGLAYVLHDGTLHSISAGQPDEEEFAFALGSAQEPCVSLFKDAVEPGDVIALASSWFARHVGADDLRAAFAERGAAEISKVLMEEVRHIGAKDASCITLEADAEREVARQAEIDTGSNLRPSPRVTVWDYVDDAVGSLAYIWRRTKAELAPPRRGRRLEHGESGMAATLTKGPEASRAAAETLPAYADNGLEDESVMEDIPGTITPTDRSGGPEHGTDEIPIVGGEQPQPDRYDTGSLERSGDPSGPHTEMEEVNAFMRRTVDVGSVSPPVQGFPDTTTEPERIYPGTSRSSPRRQNGYGALSSETMAASPRGTRRRRAGTRARSLPNMPPALVLWSGAGVALVLLMILLIVMTLGGGTNYAAAARSRADQAVAAYHRGKPALASKELAGAWTDIGRAGKNNASAQDINSATSYVQAASDTIHGVIRPPARLVTRFTATRSMPGQIATGIPDLFVLDMKRQEVWAVDPSRAGAVPTPAAKNGDTSYNTGNGNQTAWTDPRLLASNGHAIVSLDAHYKVLVQDPTAGTAVLTVEALSPPSGGRLTASTTWQGNLYLLDAGNGQVWRYIGTNNSYSPFLTTPEARLLKPGGQMRKGVSVAVAHASIYIALTDGQLLRFTQDKKTPTLDSQAAFPLSLPIVFRHATQVYARDDLKTIFLVNSWAGKIVELNTAGVYERTVVVPKRLITGMRQITVSNNGATIYFLSRRNLYSIPVS